MKKVILAGIMVEYPQARFFIDAHPIRNDMGISYTSSDDETKVVEAVVDESQYKVETGYKITLRPIDKKYAPETYYQMDFISLSKERGGKFHYVTVDGEKVELI